MKNRCLQSNASWSAESGIAMVVLAILITALVAMIGLPMDSGLLATSYSQYRSTAQYAALGAMEEYLNSTDTDINGNPDYTARLNHAVAKAQSLVGTNVPMVLGRPFFQDPNAPVSDLTAQGGNGTNGSIIPGNWDASTGVFTPVVNSAGANAIKVNLFPHSTSPLKTLFMRVVGKTSSSFSVSAIAATRPIHLFALVDLSSASTLDNFWKTNETVPGYGSTVPRSEYALRLNNALNCPAENENSFAVATGEFGVSTKAIFQGLPAARGGQLPPSVPSSLQFKDDYLGADVCKVIAWENSPSSKFALNRSVVPEPLNSYLAGVHTAMDYMLSRNVPGDLFGINGQGQIWEGLRYMGFTAPTRDISSEFWEFYEMTDPDSATPFYDRVATKGFFPNSRFVNLVQGINDAAEAFTVARTSTAEEELLVFTTGIANCRGNNNCAAKSMEMINNAYNDMTTKVNNTYVANNISIHVILGGTVEGASNVSKKYNGVDSLGRTFSCMPDYVARSVGTRYVDDTFNIATSNFFFKANGMYDFAKNTNGLFFPMRPCCTLDGCNCISAAEMASVDFQDKCSQAASNGDTVSNYGNSVLNGFINSGRMMCDPFGRDKRSQAESAVESIMSRPAVMLVG